MKVKIAALAIGLLIAVPAIAVASTKASIHWFYNKGGVKCGESREYGMNTVGCLRSDNSGYVITMNKEVVAIVNSATGKTIFKKFNRNN